MKILASIDKNWLLWPDSCWLQSNRPLFIPDFDEKFYAMPAIGFKSGRLGKCIAPKFAIRYFCSFSAALIILSQSALDAIRNGFAPAISSLCFDNAIVLSDGTPLPADAEKLTMEDSISRLAGRIPQNFEIEILSANQSRRGLQPDKLLLTGTPDAIMDAVGTAAMTLSEVSASNSIKTGDFILAPLKGIEPIELRQGQQISISTDGGKPMLLTRFK